MLKTTIANNVSGASTNLTAVSSIAKGTFNMMTWVKIKLAIAALLLLAASGGLTAIALAQLVNRQPRTATQLAASSRLTIKLVGPDGKPVMGALVGCHAGWSETTPPVFRVSFWGPNRETISDEKGKVSIDKTIADQSRFPKADEPYVFSGPSWDGVIFAITRDQQLVGVKRVNEAKVPAEVEVRMEPACRVTSPLIVPEQFKQPYVGVSEVRFAENDRSIGNAFCSCFLAEPRFEFFLPPGKYCLGSDGQYEQNGRTRHTDVSTQFITVQPGQRELKLSTELNLSWQQLHLFDRPALELRKIKAWKNGGPVKLADLRGKVVVLYFWSLACGPCLAEMPELMKLHDELKDKNFVFISIHDDAVSSVGDLDRRLAKVRAIQWKGRDLPFLTAIDGGGETAIEGTKLIAPGATFAAYGCHKFGIAVVIDRQGNVVGDVSGADNIRRMVAKELGIR
jgi:thiol-disulfide isomerase/thioredoxin